MKRLSLPLASVVAAIAVGSTVFFGSQYITGNLAVENAAAVADANGSSGRITFDPTLVQPYNDPQVRVNSPTKPFPLVPVCPSNQFMDIYGSYEPVTDVRNKHSTVCVDAPTTTVPQIDTYAYLSASTTGPSSDPYCPPLSQTQTYSIINTNAKGVRTGVTSSTHVVQVYNQSCINGEASKVSNYINPWLNQNNLMGVNYVSSTSLITSNPVGPFQGLADFSILGGDLQSTNLCSDTVSLTAAKKLYEFMAARGIQTNYMDNSTLLIESPPSNNVGSGNNSLALSQYGPISLVNRYFLTMYGEHFAYYWDGAVINDSLPNEIFRPAPADPWTDPAFQTLFHNFQLPPNYIMKCLDKNYVSNYPQWSSHFSSAMGVLRNLGLVQ